MADFKKLTVDGNTYNVKDAQARSDASAAQNTASAAYTAANLKMPLNGLFIGPVDSKATASMALGSTAPNSTTTLTAGTGANQSGISLTGAGVTAIKGSTNVTIDAGGNLIASSADIDVQTDSGEIYTDDNDIFIQANDLVKLKSGYGYALSNDEIIATRPWVMKQTTGTDPSPLPLNIPYNYRPVPDINALKKKVTLVGASICWNQLVQNGNFSNGLTGWTQSNGTATVSDGIVTYTAASQNGFFRTTTNPLPLAADNHKYLAYARIKNSSSTTYVGLRGNGGAMIKYCTSGTDWQDIYTIYTYSAYYNQNIGIIDDRPTPYAIEIEYIESHDLTDMLGSHIADYIASLGDEAGAAWFREYFNKLYYEYKARTLYSVNPDKSITMNADQSETRTYELNHKTLYGLFKLDANNRLYADGDTYEADGTFTHNYEYRAYQAGDESLPDAITDGTNTVVKLVTPTTEQTSTFEKEMTVYPDGTEALTDYAYTQGQRDFEIPVGNNTLYERKVITLPAAPITYGSYYLTAYVDNDGNTYYVWED